MSKAFYPFLYAVLLSMYFFRESVEYLVNCV